MEIKIIPKYTKDNLSSDSAGLDKGALANKVIKASNKKMKGSKNENNFS